MTGRETTTSAQNGKQATARLKGETLDVVCNCSDVARSFAALVSPSGWNRVTSVWTLFAALAAVADVDTTVSSATWIGKVLNDVKHTTGQVGSDIEMVRSAMHFARVWRDELSRTGLLRWSTEGEVDEEFESVSVCLGNGVCVSEPLTRLSDPSSLSNLNRRKLRRLYSPRL